MKNITLSKKNRPKGLFLFCNSCNKQYSDDKKIKCKCGNLIYKAKIHVAGTKHGVKPKVLAASNFKEALIEFQEYKEVLQNNNYQKVEIKHEVNTPTRLIECFAYYMGFLNNVGVPIHKQKKRDPKYIGKFDFLFEQYKQVLL